jgi:hypothetical protein
MINIINGWNRIAVGFGLFADPADIKSTGFLQVAVSKAPPLIKIVAAFSLGALPIQP